MKKFGIITALILAISIAGSVFASPGIGSKSGSANSKTAKYAKESSKVKKHKKVRKAKKAMPAPTKTPEK
jgi:hypothetical protein